MPGGLTHHWRAAISIPRVTLNEVVTASHAYRDYPSIFPPVLSATVLADKGASLGVQFRIRESAGGMSATLDIRSNISYVRVDANHAYTISISDEIRQVEDAGRPTERRLPVGRDSGYLWHACAFTKFVADNGGVYMEMETIGLSRPFPPLLGWLIEPIARRVGRRSVEDSVQQFRRAVLMRHGRDGQPVADLRTPGNLAPARALPIDEWSGRQNSPFTITGIRVHHGQNRCSASAERAFTLKRN